MNNILQETINLDDYFVTEKLIDGKIYKITNTINKKIYIGQTIKSIIDRFKGHCLKASISISAISNAINKYGKENFLIEQIDSATSYSELNQKEYDWIVKENCLAPNGYNLRDGGMMGSVSEETRLKHSISSKGRKSIYNPETNEQRFIFGEILPDGFIFGINEDTYKSEDRRMKLSKANKNRIPIIELETGSIRRIKRNLFDEKTMKTHKQDHAKNRTAYHSTETKQTIMLKEDQEIPEGFIKGAGYEREECSEETRRKLSAVHKGKEREYKFNNENVKGRKYYNNPNTKQVIMLKEDQEIPEGFIKGRGFFVPKDYKKSEELLQRLSEIIKNKIWINNPILKINKRIDKDDDIPEGFIRGRLKKI
jgi:group I intron endonuclease